MLPWALEGSPAVVDICPGMMLVPDCSLCLWGGVVPASNITHSLIVSVAGYC